MRMDTSWCEKIQQGTTSYAFVMDTKDLSRVIRTTYTSCKINLFIWSIYNKRVTSNTIYFSNFETFRLLIHQSRSHRGSIVIEIAQNIHPTIVTYRNRAYQSLMLVSECIGTYPVVTDPGHLSLWSRHITMESQTQSWYSYQIVCDYVYPGHRSYHQKLANRYQNASKRNKSYQNAWYRTNLYLIIKFQQSYTIRCDWPIVMIVTDCALVWTQRQEIIKSNTSWDIGFLSPMTRIIVIP